MPVKVHAFAYLPLLDRETVRLVCKDWYDAAWSRKLIINDWVKLSGDQFSSIDAKMSRMCDVFSAQVGGGKPSNFQIRFPEGARPGDARFWNMFGPHIFHLQLRNTRLQPLQLILERCKSLKTLDLTHSSAYLPDASETSLATIRDNLRGLRVLSCYSSFFAFDDGEIDVLSKCRLSSVHYSASIDLAEQEVTEFLAKHEVKNICLNITGDEEEEIISSESCAKLRNLLLNKELSLTDFLLQSLNRTSFPLAQCVFANIPAHSETLTKLNLTLFQDVDNSVFIVIIRGLNRLSRLEECAFIVPRAIVTALVHSVLSNNRGLKVLSVEETAGGDAALWSWPADRFVEGLSDSMRSLSIEEFTVGGFLVNCGTLATFAKSLTSLTLREAGDLDNTAMQLICKECTGLRALAVVNCNRLTVAGLTGRPRLPATAARSRERYGLSNLKKLETLKLVGGRFDAAATVAELRFPGLRSLSVTLASMSNMDILLIASNNPHLETFSTTHGLASSPMTWACAVYLLEHCPRLTSLYVAAPEDDYYAAQDDDESMTHFTDAQMRTVRNRFPTLKRLNKNRLHSV